MQTASPDEAQEKEDDDDDSGSDPDMESLESNQGKKFNSCGIIIANRQ